jgi:GntR family transcriptional repressor for pyruvate dehydrogenase complex
VDHILARLTEVIVEVGARGGAARLRLPAERDLASRLQIQRSTLRERLATLEHLGMLERTQGSGTYVNLMNSDFIRLFFDLALALGYIGADEMEGARELLEREIARQAARVASKEDIDELETICRRMEEAATTEACLAADYQFHMKLAHSARNPVITLIIEGLSSVLRRVLARRRYVVRSLPDAAAQQNATHMPIVETLRRRDPEEAMAAMDEHFRVTNELQAKVRSALMVSGDGIGPTPPEQAPGRKTPRPAKQKGSTAPKRARVREEHDGTDVVPARGPIGR